MAIEVFNRYENKYFLDEDRLARLTRKLGTYMELDAFNRDRGAYTIANLYYDTPDHALIRTSLQKPSYKEKLRLRAYGTPSADSEVFVEIKRKVRGLVNKRRSAISLHDAYDFLATAHMPPGDPAHNAQVLHEVQYMLGNYELRPAVYLAYDRIAYFGRGMHDLRVSFDTNIRTRRDDLSLEAGDHGTLLLPDRSLWLMEIKVARSIPLWLSRLLSDFGLYPTSFSKYGAEYKRFVDEAQRGGVSGRDAAFALHASEANRPALPVGPPRIA